jgi:hypothetical protein
MLLRKISSKAIHSFLFLLAALMLIQMCPSAARAESYRDGALRTDLITHKAPIYTSEGKPEDWESPSQGMFLPQGSNLGQGQGSSGGGEGNPEDWGSPSLWRDFGNFGFWRPVLTSLFGFIFSWQV